MKNILLLLVISFCFIAESKTQSPREGYYSSFDKTRIFYTVRGGGEPVLLIHGFSGDGSGWLKQPLHEKLIQGGFTVITVDLRGNGKSDKPHDSTAYQNDAEAKDLMGLMTALGYKKYKALGYSRGSIILARLLVLDERLSAAILGGMGADFTNPLWPRRIAFAKAMMNDTTPGFEAFYKRIKDNNLDQLALAYQQLGQPSTSKEDLGKVSKPVLVICGEQDQDNGNGQELAALIPGAKFTAVPGNHGSAWGSPEFAAVSLAFLKK